MVMYISKETVDLVQASVSIEDVIRATGYLVSGTGRSKSVENCPRCGRDHTHIKINPSKNLFKCFSPVCNFAGNQFQWVMEVEKCSFPESVLKVAEIGGLDIHCSNNDFFDRKQQALQETLIFYESHYQHDYLHGRGISLETARAFHCGFAPGGVFLKKYLNSKGFDNGFLLDIGLIRQVGNKLMDRFYRCIIIPDIRDGIIHDFYGRSIDPMVFTKHLYLYGHQSFIGLHLVKPTSREAFIVEAPVDAMSLHQRYGIPALSTGGAGKFNNWHVYQLKSRSLSPILANDNDESGQKANYEAIELLEDHHIKSKVFCFHDVNDANELIQQNLHGQVIPSQDFKYDYFLSSIPIEYIEAYLKKEKR